MVILNNNWDALRELWTNRQHQYEQCLDLHLFYRDSEQVDSWMSRQEVTGGVNKCPEIVSPLLIYHHNYY